MWNIARHVIVQVLIQVGAHGISGLETVDYSSLGSIAAIYGPIAAAFAVAVYHKAVGTAS